MKNFFKNLKKHLIISAIAYILLGIVLCIWPQVSSTVLSYMLAILLLVYGITHLMDYLALDIISLFARFDLISGVIAMGLGVFIVIRPDFLFTILPFIAGIYILLDALKGLRESFMYKDAGYEGWWKFAVYAIVLALLGILLVINPFSSSLLLVRCIGAVFVIDGIGDLVSIYTTSKTIKEIKKQITPIDIEIHEEDLF